MGHVVTHLGIDLGTTNTVAAVFDGETIDLVRNSDGATLTPSVVRIDGKGRVTVGSRARKMLDRDPENTRGEFKRLMGTDKAIRFPGPAVDRRPEELAAEILRSVRHDVREQLGFEPERAVISVPAVFELPQSSATSVAAQLSGFERVELIQEPVASALAAGWSAEEDAGGAWLVYDLGGGTFDLSLLETRDGLLRVVGHEGDNFLGGRDIDQTIVEWVLARLAEDGHAVDRADPAHAVALRILRSAAEDTKIDLSRGREAAVSLPELFEVGGKLVDVDLVLDRKTLEGLTAPLIDRSIALCRRLLASHGLAPEQLQRIVLVGGPTVMPFLRDRVKDALGTPFAEGIDPMALVARGAAIYAATAGLDARPRPAPDVARGRRVWLEYPTMSSDPTPFVVGRLLDGPETAPQELRFVRDDGAFASAWTRLGADGTVMVLLELASRRPNTFTLEGRDGSQEPVAVLPPSLTIVHGMTVSDPPLARSVGVALANDTARTYLERGTPLPAKRTHVHQTVETVSAGSADAALLIPIIQGEMRQAHLCRLIGRLEITGRELRGPLPAGSDVEVTIEVDRGGRLSARALVPRLDQAFEQVAHLSVPDADPAALAIQLGALRDRLGIARGIAGADARHIDRLVDVEWALQDAETAIVTARGGDDDAAQKARRLLIDADAALGDAEDTARWPELDARSAREVIAAASWVGQFGTAVEQRMLDESAAAVARAREGRRAVELERHLGSVRELASAAYFRHPDAWRWELDHAASDIGRCTDPVKAQELVRDARAALAAGNTDRLRTAVIQLKHLLPGDVRQQALSYGSGVR